MSKCQNNSEGRTDKAKLLSMQKSCDPFAQWSHRQHTFQQRRLLFTGYQQQLAFAANLHKKRMFCCFASSTPAFLLVCFCSCISSYDSCQYIHWNTWGIFVELTMCFTWWRRWSAWVISDSGFGGWQVLLIQAAYPSPSMIALEMDMEQVRFYCSPFFSWVWRAADLWRLRLTWWFYVKLYFNSLWTVLNLSSSFQCLKELKNQKIRNV